MFACHEPIGSFSLSKYPRVSELIIKIFNNRLSKTRYFFIKKSLINHKIVVKVRTKVPNLQTDIVVSFK